MAHQELRGAAGAAVRELDVRVAIGEVATTGERHVDCRVLTHAQLLREATNLQEGTPRVGAVRGWSIQHAGGLARQVCEVVQKVGSPTRQGARPVQRYAGDHIVAEPVRPTISYPPSALWDRPLAVCLPAQLEYSVFQRFRRDTYPVQHPDGHPVLVAPPARSGSAPTCLPNRPRETGPGRSSSRTG